ncbi:MAG: hypothetical protein QXL89_09575, partial [Nitrososphaeria archaeon]
MSYDAENLEQKALRLLLEAKEPINLPYLLKTIKPEYRNVSRRDKNYHRDYMRLYRTLKQLSNVAAIELKKADGLIWITIRKPHLIDLISREAHAKLKLCDFTQKVEGMKRIRYERREALKIVQNVNCLTDLDVEELNDLFNSYVDDINDRRIILLAKDPNIPPEKAILLLPYETRFNSKRKKKIQIAKYTQIWRKATANFKDAVFLTLTSDPKRFPNLLAMWMHFQVAWNRFITYIRKIVGIKPIYLCVYEFTEKGFLHAHVIFFGIKFLLKKGLITRVWERCQQGTINYVYALKNADGKWVWKKEKPEKAQGDITVDKYLIKYIKKALTSNDSQVLYWVSNKRYYSYSIKFFRLKYAGKRRLGLFKFFGSYRIFDLPYWATLW